MFSLGDKFRVLNADADVKVYDASGSEVTTAAAVALTDEVRVAGFGSFKLADITDIRLRRAVAPAVESKDFTVVAPAGLSIGEAVEVKVYLKTSRYESELKNNFIGAARPIIFSTAALAGVTVSDIRTAIVAGWTAHKGLFNMAVEPIEVSTGSAGTDIEVAATAGYESVSIERVELKRVAQGIASQSPVSLAVGATNALGNEGVGYGKFLEESVRMATAENTGVYGIDNTDAKVDVRASYSEVTFVVAAAYDSLSTDAADAELTGKHRFTMFCNEATMIAANGALDKLAAGAVEVAGAVTGLQATINATPDEELEALILADGTSTDNTAGNEFIA